MARIEAVVTQEVKDKLIEIAADNRSLTNMIIKLIEDRYKILKGGK